MASTEEGTEGDSFPAVNPTRELNLGVPEEFPVDPVSADVTTAKDLKEEAEARTRAKAAEAGNNCSLCSNLTSVLIITGVVAAAIGVAFIVTKNLKTNT